MIKFFDHLKVPKFQAPFGRNFSALGASRFGTFAQKKLILPDFNSQSFQAIFKRNICCLSTFLLRNVNIPGNQQILFRFDFNKLPSIGNSLNRFNPIGPVHSVRFNPIHFGSESIAIHFFCFDSIGPISIRSVRFNLLNPIQSNRPDSIRFGPIRSDSVRFRIRYNAFGPIQIF